MINQVCKYTFILVVLILLTNNFSSAQQKEPITQNVVNQQLWVDWYFNVKKNDRINYVFDFGYETIFLEDYWNKVYHESSINYKLSKQFSLKGGIALYYHFNKDIQNRFELRPWQAIVLHLMDNQHWSFNVQVKLEQRLSYLTESWNPSFDLRLRTRIGGAYYFTNKSVRTDWYIPFVAEYYYPLKDNIPEVFHNVAKVGVGVGKVIKNKWNFSFISNWQYSRSGPKDEYKVSDFAYQFQVTKYIGY